MVGECDTSPAAALNASRGERFGEAEVQHLHRPVVSHLDVRGLQVAVDDAELVRGFKCFGDLPRNRQRLVKRNGTLRDAIGERRALNQLEDERADAVALFEPVRSQRCVDD